MPITKATASSIAPAAKGDLVVGSATNDASVLAVGSANQVLTVDSSTSTGLKWAAPATPSFVGVSLQKTGDVTIANNTYTALLWDTENFDTDAFHSTVTNTSRITIPSGKGGKYQINAQVRWDDNTTNSREIELRKNNTLVKTAYIAPSAVYPSNMMSVIIELVATDYLEIFARQDSGGTRTLYYSGTQGFFQATYLGA
jgi:hypothetical protein